MCIKAPVNDSAPFLNDLQRYFFLPDIKKGKGPEKVCHFFQVPFTHYGFAYHFTGRVNQNFDPSPFFDSTPIVPPSSCTMLLHIWSPSPHPEMSLFSFTNRPKTLSRSCSSIPIPVSFTYILRNLSGRIS